MSSTEPSAAGSWCDEISVCREELKELQLSSTEGLCMVCLKFYQTLLRNFKDQSWPFSCYSKLPMPNSVRRANHTREIAWITCVDTAGGGNARPAEQRWYMRAAQKCCGAQWCSLPSLTSVVPAPLLYSCSTRHGFSNTRHASSSLCSSLPGTFLLWKSSFIKAVSVQLAQRHYSKAHDWTLPCRQIARYFYFLWYLFHPVTPAFTQTFSLMWAKMLSFMNFQNDDMSRQWVIQLLVL